EDIAGVDDHAGVCGSDKNMKKGPLSTFAAQIPSTGFSNRNGKPVSKPSLQYSYAVPNARLHSDGRFDAGSRHRREHGGLLRDRRRSVAAASVSTRGSSRAADTNTTEELGHQHCAGSPGRLEPAEYHV